MPSLNKSTSIKEMRERKQWMQAQLLYGKTIGDATLSRIENNHQAPYSSTYNKVMEKFKVPTTTLYCPFLINQTTDVYKMRRNILHYLERTTHSADVLQQAADLIKKMKQLLGFEAGINKQFILRCEAKIALIKNKNPRQIIDTTQEAINITFPEYNPNTFEGDTLLYNEIPLVHIQALAQAKTGRIHTAITLLQRIQTSLSRLPQDDKDKETYLVPILLDLSCLLLDSGLYEQALQICNEGSELSIKRNKGKYNPDFAFVKAKVLHAMGTNQELSGYLSAAYFGFALMRNSAQMQAVLQYAQRKEININTYDATQLSMDISPLSFERGKPIPCNNFGEFMRGLRKSVKLSQTQLCEGICNESTLSRMEKNKEKTPSGNVYHLEAFMQRMGRDIDEYFYTFLSTKDFNEKQMRDEVRILLALRQYDKAEVLLDELKTKKSYQEGINLQFVKLTIANIYNEKNGYDTRHMQLLMEAWRVAKGKLDEDEISHMRMTHFEMIILNQVALNLCQTDEQERGVQILEDILKSLKRNYDDESAWINIHLTVLYNYTKYLGIMGYRKKALTMAMAGYELCVIHNDLWHASLLATNIAVNTLELEGKEKSVPFFFASYYGAVLMERTRSQKIISEYIQERFKISL